jgi:uncharacterized coiled-coil protein SlyX
MATEQSDGEALSVDLPPDLKAWLAERATAQDTEPEALLIRLLESTRLVLNAEADPAELETRVAALETELDEKIDDVRSRVIQVKRETDRKASADHEAFERVDDLEARLTALEDDLAALESQVTAVETTTESHDDRLETLADRLRRAATAVIRLRDSTGADTAGGRLAEIKRLAATRGFERADCGACGESVHLGLLTEPRCPHCDASFADVTGRSGFLSTPTLVGEDES